MLQILDELTGRDVAVRFHREHITFTGEDNPLPKLQLQIIGAVAEFERTIIKERQRKGIRAAQKAGKQIGRAKALTPLRLKRSRPGSTKARRKRH